MKKIVFLLFVCLNLFAQEVYDLKDKTTNTAAGWFIYNENENLNLASSPSSLGKVYIYLLAFVFSWGLSKCPDVDKCSYSILLL